MPNDANIESITLLVKEKDLTIINKILNFLSEKYSDFKVIKFKTGKIGEDFLISFKIKHKYYSEILEKFAYNDIQLIMRDKSSLQYIDKKKEQKRRKLRAQGWSEIKKEKSSLTLNDLDKLANQGKLKEIAKEAKGVIGSKTEIVSKAQSLLTLTIENAIKNLIDYTFEKPGLRSDAIDELILIASDKDLKLFSKNAEMDKAAMASIELSVSHKNYYEKLIKIANNTKLSNIININAALALNDLFEYGEDNIENFPNVVKNLNTRWLRIAFETAQFKLTDENQNKFKSFIKSIDDQRQAA